MYSPNLIIRLGYLIAIIVPLIKNRELFPAAIICFLSVSRNTFAYPLLPTEGYYYTILSLLFASLVLFNDSKGGFAAPKLLYGLILLYVFLIDIIVDHGISRMTTTIFVCLLFFVCVGKNTKSSVYHLSLSFIIISLVLSYWVLFIPEAQINVYNSVEGMEQAGWTDPNYLGCVVGMGTIVAIQELLNKGKNVLYTVLLILVMVLSVVALSKIASRGALLAVAVGTLSMVLLSKRSFWSKLSVVALIAVAVYVMYNNDYFEFVIARVQNDAGTGSGRTEIWKEKLRAFTEEGTVARWLFGYGQHNGIMLGNFGRARAFHNDYVAVLVEYGIVGFILLFAAFVNPVMMVSKQKKSTIIAMLLYLMTCSLTVDPLTFGNLAYLGFYFYITQIARDSRQVELYENGTED